MDARTERFSALFDGIDVDKNGRINRDDFVHVAVALAREAKLFREHPAVRQIHRALSDVWEAILRNVDMDGSGDVDRDEFVVFGELLCAESDALGGHSPPGALEIVDAVWTALDGDRDGRVGPAEWALFLRAMGVAVDPVATFQAFDRNGDGVLDRTELDRLVTDWLHGV